MENAYAALVPLALEQLRRRLSWRKWLRNVGAAYTAPLARDSEIEWLRANGHCGDGRLIRELRARAARAAATGATSNAELRHQLVQTELLEFYELEYLRGTSAFKFLVWYSLNIERLVGKTAAAAAQLDEFLEAYFRPTFELDCDTRCLDDACLWYYAECIVGEPQRLFSAGPRTLEYRCTTSGRSLLRIRADDGAGPRIDSGDAAAAADGKPLAKLAENPFRFYATLAMLLSVHGDTQTPNGLPFVSNAKLAFEVARRAPGKPGDTQASVIDRVRWRRIVWRPRVLMHGLHRLTPVANAVQLAARGRLDDASLSVDKSGLVSDAWEARFAEEDEEETSSGGSSSSKADLYVTNVMVQHDDVSGSFFLLHEHDPRLVSVFVRPDQDPAVTHTMDLDDDDDENLVERTDLNGKLRWVIAVVGSSSSSSNNDDDIRDSMNLMLLLRDLETALPDAAFTVDSFLAADPPSAGVATTTTTATYTSVRTWPEADTDIARLCRRFARDGVVLLGRPKTGHYAPALSTLFWQSERGFVPWSLDQPDLLTWKAYTCQPIDHMRTVGVDQVNLLVQHERDTGWYALSAKNEIAQYLGGGDTPLSWLRAPIVRAISSDALPFSVRKVAAKRIFALDDGTLFVSRKPLKIVSSSSSSWMTARAGKYLTLDGTTTLTVKPVDRSPKSLPPHFARGSILGSEVWYPLPVRSTAETRCYAGDVPREIAPLVQWLDSQLSLT